MTRVVKTAGIAKIAKVAVKTTLAKVHNLAKMTKEPNWPKRPKC